MPQEPPSALTFLDRFDKTPYDRQSISQEELDLANKLRTSLFAWRGQFSPELIELLLENYANRNSYTPVVLDPFAGSGTTLFECARQGLACYASEINPAAVVMASTIHFANVRPTDRESYIQAAESIARAHVETLRYDLFSYQERTEPLWMQSGSAIQQTFVPILEQAAGSPLVHNLLANTIIRYAGYSCRREDAVTRFLRCFREHATIVRDLPYSQQTCRIFHADARSIPLLDHSVDLIITSPPYINVFNYHQNSRWVMELMGWDMLHVARSEIGSNRRNRQNRFLTVIQYAVDILDVLLEMRRLLRAGGRAIVVVGRESNVRGVSFRNGRLVAALATGGAGFDLIGKQERNFRNKFGEVIYEDILHLVTSASAEVRDDAYARSVARLVLAGAAAGLQGAIRDEVLDAMARVPSVEGSPRFRLQGGAGVAACVF